jgi:hypothetical protein
VARLSPLKAHLGPRRLGQLDGQFRIPDDFNAPLPDKVLRRFQRSR